MRKTLTLLAMVPVLVLAATAPAWAQTNSPAGNQPSASTPDTSAGGPSNQSGANTGSDDVTGNRTTGGGAGATGGGAAAETEGSGGGGGAGKMLVAFLVVLAIAGALAMISITRRNRGAEERLESAGKA